MTLKELKIIAKQYDIPVFLRKNSGRRDGGSTNGNSIWLYPTNKPWVREMSFWHELGHIMLEREVGKSWGYTMSTVSAEGAAWEIGLKFAAQHDRVWKFHSKELEWARKQLASYVGGEYDFLPYRTNQLGKARNIDGQDKLGK